jgi:hypothetical protein
MSIAGITAETQRDRRKIPYMKVLSHRADMLNGANDNGQDESIQR